MYMVAAKLSGSADRSLPDAQDLSDLFWAHCEAADGVEHVRCISGPGKVGVLLFVQCRDANGAVAAAAAVCQRIIGDVPLLCGWHLDSCSDVTTDQIAGPKA
jgi:hypothetical protein